MIYLRVMFARSVLSLCSASVLFWGCEKDSFIREELPADNIGLVVPEGWPAPTETFSDNPFSKDIFILGRRLFYDKQLSSDNTISCGSCHQQFAGFANKERAVSTGAGGMTGRRNSPVLFNLNWNHGLMWDGAAARLIDQPQLPLTSHIEMNETIEDVIRKLENDHAYPALFRKAFGDDGVSKERIMKALSQFLGMLVSADSRFDQYQRGISSLSSTELSGFYLVQSKCGSCHPAPLFTSGQFVNNGLDSVFTDAGRAEVTHLDSDAGKFKIPTLRNLSISKPYMHDGRYATLEEVLDHYSSLHNSSTVSPALAGGIPLTTQEKSDILAFLETLNDVSFTHDKRFNNPFLN